jgi:hypothetical protein
VHDLIRLRRLCLEPTGRLADVPAISGGRIREQAPQPSRHLRGSLEAGPHWQLEKLSERLDGLALRPPTLDGST